MGLLPPPTQRAVINGVLSKHCDPGYNNSKLTFLLPKKQKAFFHTWWIIPMMPRTQETDAEGLKTKVIIVCMEVEGPPEFLTQKNKV